MTISALRTVALRHIYLIGIFTISTATCSPTIGFEIFQILGKPVLILYYSQNIIYRSKHQFGKRVDRSDDPKVRLQQVGATPRPLVRRPRSADGRYRVHREERNLRGLDVGARFRTKGTSAEMELFTKCC